MTLLYFGGGTVFNIRFAVTAVVGGGARCEIDIVADNSLRP
jgi:hypothetical protein